MTTQYKHTALIKNRDRHGSRWTKHTDKDNGTRNSQAKANKLRTPNGYERVNLQLASTPVICQVTDKQG